MYPAHRREHRGGHLQHQPVGTGKLHHSRQISGVVGGQTDVQLDRQPRLGQQADGPRHLRESVGIAAQAGIGIVRGAIQADIDPHRRGLLQPRHRIGINKSTVGINGDEQTHTVQPLHNGAELRVEKGLAAGQQQIQHTRLHRLAPQCQPLVGIRQRTQRPLLVSG